MSDADILTAAADILRRMAGDVPGQNDHYMRMCASATCVLAICQIHDGQLLV